MNRLEQVLTSYLPFCVQASVPALAPDQFPNLPIYHGPMPKHKKQDLPTKICPVCGRPFTWRKKWARHWDEVVYCSERCRRRRSQSLDEARQPVKDASHHEL